MSETLTQYGKNFQSKILTSLITDVKYTKQILDIVEVNYFDSDSNKFIIKSIKDYFHPRPDIEALLKNRGELELLKTIQGIQNLVDINFVTQESPLGLGHAILQSKPLIKDETFVVLLPDDLIFGNESTTSEMIKIFYKNSSLN